VVSTAITPKVPKPAPSEKKSSSKIILIAAVAVVVLAVAGYFIFSGGPKPETLSAPVLLSPTNAATVDTNLPNLTWQALNRNDVSYILEYAADSSFSNPIEKQVVLATNYTPAGPLSNGSYYWRVQAQDRQGNKGPLSGKRMFTVAVAPTETTVPEATLTVKIKPRGDIYIDNELFGKNKSDAEIKLDTGWHDVRVVNQASEQKARSDRVYLADGASESRTFEFTFAPAAPKVDSGEVAIGSLPIDDGAIFIDGQLQELRTNNTFRLPVGRHTIKVVLTLDGSELEQSDSVVVVKGETKRKLFNFEK
jgi:hypothetical protein